MRRNKNFYTTGAIVLFVIWSFIGLSNHANRLYGDVAYYLNEMINTKSFFIAHTRPGAVLIEWLPLLMIKLNQRLDLVVWSMSLAELVYLAIMVAVFFRLNRPNYAFFMLLSYLIGIRWNFFNPVSELILAAPLVFFLPIIWEYIVSSRKPWIWYAVLFLLSLFLIFSHPLLSIVVLLQLAFVFVENVKDSKWYISFSIVVCIMALRWLMLDQYEKAPLKGLGESDTFESMLSRFINLSAIYDLVKAYGGTMIILIIALVFGQFKKKSLQPFLLISFCAGWALLVVYKFSYLYPQTFEPFERYLFIVPLGICLIASQINIALNKRVITCFALVVAFHTFTLDQYAKFVEFRYGFLDVALDNIKDWPEKKVYFRKENYFPSVAEPRIYGHDWILGNESLVRSSMNGPLSTRQIFIKEVLDSLHLARLLPVDYLYTYQYGANVNTLNTDYFRLPADSWSCANTDGSQQQLSMIGKDRVTARFLTPTSEFGKNKSTVDIEILNRSGVVFHSGHKQEKLFIISEWTDKLEKKILSLEAWTPMIMDLRSTLRQKIIIKQPLSKGTFKVRIALLRERDRFYLPISNFETIEI